jgi:hypothetical protein
MFAQRHQVREADAAAAGPVEHGGDQRARLRHEGQFAVQRAGMGKACVQSDGRHLKPDAVGPQHTQQMRARRLKHRASLVAAQPRREDDGRTGSRRSQLGHQARHRRRRRADDGQLWHLGQLGHGASHGAAIELRQPAVQRHQRAPEPGATQVAPDRGADPPRPVGRPNHGHRGRREQGVEVADAHGSIPDAPRCAPCSDDTRAR